MLGCSLMCINEWIGGEALDAELLRRLRHFSDSMCTTFRPPKIPGALSQPSYPLSQSISQIRKWNCIDHPSCLYQIDLTQRMVKMGDPV